MLRIRDRVEGARGRPGDPEHGAGGDQHLRAPRKSGEHRGDAERGGANQKESPAADPIAESAHGDQESGQQKPIDVIHRSWELVGSRSAVRDGTARYSTSRSME